jgi:hypothetical protein
MCAKINNSNKRCIKKTKTAVFDMNQIPLQLVLSFSELDNIFVQEHYKIKFAFKLSKHEKWVIEFAQLDFLIIQKHRFSSFLLDLLNSISASRLTDLQSV